MIHIKSTLLFILPIFFVSCYREKEELNILSEWRPTTLPLDLHMIDSLIFLTSHNFNHVKYDINRNKFRFLQYYYVGQTSGHGLHRSTYEFSIDSSLYYGNVDHISVGYYYDFNSFSDLKNHSVKPKFRWLEYYSVFDYTNYYKNMLTENKWHLDSIYNSNDNQMIKFQAYSKDSKKIETKFDQNERTFILNFNNTNTE